MRKILSLWLCTGMAFAALAGTEDLLITEIAVVPTNGEFIEIYNNGNSTVDLTDVYLTDATFAGGGTYYYQLVTGGGGGGGFADFFARFPAGATIGAGEYQTIALAGSDAFFSEWGENPTYELFEDGAVDGIPDMLEATVGSINNQGGLTNSGEVVVLFSWDGNTDLVQDLDYVVWGDKVEAIDKSGVAIDGPDGDSVDSTYLNDTSIASQIVVSTAAHNSGNSWQRIDFTEGAEVQTGGNGLAGSDETSENTDFTFAEDAATPNAASNISPPVAQFLINEIDAVSSGSDFVELLGNANTATDGYSLVMYDGATDTVSNAISLDGQSTDASGYLLINTTLDDGADAVALYVSDASNFPNGAALTTTDLMDAVVYDSGQADDVGLLTLLNAGQPQVNEDENGQAINESLIRCSNGSGGQLNTTTFKAFTPSPGAANENCVTLDGYYDSADDTNATTLRNTLHEIIDDHISYPYSAGTTDTWDVLSVADEDPNPAVDLDPMVTEQVWMVYKNNSYQWLGGGVQAYNREHTWPQSYGFSSGDLGDDNPARTDAHHLMLSDVDYNSDRGNKYFDNCVSGCTELPTDSYNGQGGAGESNWYNGSVFEVWDARKGDIARAMFYMAIRYEGNAVNEVDLELTDNPAEIQTGQPKMGLLSVLLEWHEQDPVDLIELYRNDEVFALQENRNPFVDHPEWVECIFVVGGTCSTQADDLIFANGFE